MFYRKSKGIPKNIYFCFIDYAKDFDCVDHNKLWNILNEMGIPDHTSCLLRNLYAGQEATIRNGYETTDWFQIKKGVCQGCVFSPCLFNLYANYITKNAGLHESQTGIKIAGWNNNHLRSAEDTTLMAESKEELRSLLVKWKRRVKKAGLNLNIQKAKMVASGPIIPWQIDGETMETVRFHFLGSKINADSDCSHEIKRCLFLGRIDDKPRQCTKKQRHHFANKGPYNQSYGVSSSHVWAWELDHKEGWALKNCCFPTVVLENTL